MSTRKLRLEKFRSQPAQLAALQKNETDVGRERENGREVDRNEYNMNKQMRERNEWGISAKAKQTSACETFVTLNFNAIEQ